MMVYVFYVVFLLLSVFAAPLLSLLQHTLPDHLWSAFPRWAHLLLEGICFSLFRILNKLTLTTTTTLIGLLVTLFVFSF